MTQTLLLIFAALALIIGSFVWFVLTWDASQEQPVTLRTSTSAPFILANKLPPEGPPAAGAYFTEKGST